MTAADIVRSGGSVFPCPRCQTNTRIYDSRYIAKSGYRYRRRKCVSCSFRFTTRETAVELFVLDYSI